MHHPNHPCKLLNEVLFQINCHQIILFFSLFLDFYKTDVMAYSVVVGGDELEVKLIMSNCHLYVLWKVVPGLLPRARSG